METLWSDLKFSLRLLTKSFGFTAVAVISLAFGIGLNTAIFSIVNALLIRTLPVEQIDRLVEVYTGDSTGPYSVSSYPDYFDYRDENQVFESLACHSVTTAAFNDGQNSEHLFGELVSGSYFRTLGIQATQGRTLTPQDDQTQGAHPVVMLGHAFWQRRFGGDPGIVGRSIQLNGLPYTVIGVAPEYFKGSIPIMAMDFWVPTMMQAQLEGENLLERRNRRGLSMKGRLKPGVSVEQALANLQVISKRLAEAYPETNERLSINLLPTSEVSIHPLVDGPLAAVAALLMVVVGMVLLVACTNVANMLLARASVRSKEIAMRLAIGAGRWRVIRQLLTESVVLALAGGLLGVVLAYWASRLLLSFKPPLAFSPSLDISPDGRVLAFTLLLSVATGILFGLAPALRMTRADLFGTLKNERTVASGGARTFGMRNLLIIAQVAVSMMLLICAGLFVRSLGEAQGISPGFNIDQTAYLTINTRILGYSDGEQGLNFLEALKERVGALPGVQSVAVASRIPLSPGINRESLYLEGRPEPEEGEAPAVDAVRVGPDYFDTLQISVLRGRGSTAGDTQEAPLVVAVSEALARRYWPGEDPLGKRLSYESFSGPYAEVVGVIADTKVNSLGETPQPYLYIPFRQSYHHTPSLAARTSGSPNQMLQQMHRAAEEVHPGLVVFEEKTMQQHLAVSLFPYRMAGGLLGGLGALALLLAVIGVYGVVSYSVERRTHEVGIRMAMGAERKDVLKMVAWQSMKVVLIGVVLGLLAAAGLSSLLSSFLVGVDTLDPLTFVSIPLLLVAAALLAGLIPARRAMQVDPLMALRYE